MDLSLVESGILEYRHGEEEPFIKKKMGNKLSRQLDSVNYVG